MLNERNVTVNKTRMLALSGLALIAGATNVEAQDPAAISDADIKTYAAAAEKVKDAGRPQAVRGGQERPDECGREG